MRSVHSPQRKRSVLPTRPSFTAHHKKHVRSKRRKPSPATGVIHTFGVFVVLFCPELDLAQIPDRKPRLHTHIETRPIELKNCTTSNASPQRIGKKPTKILTTPRIPYFFLFLFGFVHRLFFFSFFPRGVIKMTNGHVSVRRKG